MIKKSFRKWMITGTLVAACAMAAGCGDTMEQETDKPGVEDNGNVNDVTSGDEKEEDGLAEDLGEDLGEGIKDIGDGIGEGVEDITGGDSEKENGAE